MHRPDRTFVLIQSSLESSPAFVYVAAKTADQPDIIRRINENTHIQKVENARFRKDQNAFNDHNGLRFDDLDLVAACVRDEIVERHLDLQTLFQPHQMVDKHVAVDRVRMIEIRLMTFIERHVRKIAVIRILLDQDDILAPDSLHDRTRYRGLSRTGSTANANEHKVNSNRIYRIGRMKAGSLSLSCPSCVSCSIDRGHDAPQQFFKYIGNAG